MKFDLVEFFSCQHLVCFFIFRDCLVNDILRQFIIAVRMRFEPVTYELLIIGWLRFPRRISFQRPETRTVRRQNLITEDDLAMLIQAKLKFRISDDDATCPCIVRTFFVNGNRIIADFFRIFHSMAGERFLEYFCALF